MFELTNEAKRRQDMIRHGKFTAAWQIQAAGASHLVLMPIPQTQLAANPLLTPNPWYRQGGGFGFVLPPYPALASQAGQGG